MHPLVSVVIPVYKVEKYLAKCVDSVICQTYSYIEIILVDDGSPDECPCICDEYAEKYPNITVIHQSNLGLSEARNSGLKIAAGKYVYFLDSDDYVWEDAIEILVNAAENEQADIVLFDGSVVEEDGSNSKNRDLRKNYVKGSRYPKAISGADMLCQLSRNGGDYTSLAQLLFIRREFLLENDLSFYPGIIHEDELFTFQALISAKRVFHVPEKLYIRRMRGNSIMSSKITGKNILGYCQVVSEMIDFCDSLPDTMQYNEFAWRVFNILSSALRKNEALEDSCKNTTRQNLLKICEKMQNSPFIKRQLKFNFDIYPKYKVANRIIFYGAGKKCRIIVEMLVNMNVRLPDEVWDADALNKAPILDVKVIYPDYAKLRSKFSWMVIVCVVDYGVYEEVRKQCMNYGFENVYYWMDFVTALKISGSKF